MKSNLLFGSSYKVNSKMGNRVLKMELLDMDFKVGIVREL